MPSSINGSQIEKTFSGATNYALAYVALFSSIATLGLDGIVVRNLVHTPDAKNQILGSAFILKVIGSLLAISLCVISIFLVEPESRSRSAKSGDPAFLGMGRGPAVADCRNKRGGLIV